MGGKIQSLALPTLGKTKRPGENRRPCVATRCPILRNRSRREKLSRGDALGPAIAQLQDVREELAIVSVSHFRGVRDVGVVIATVRVPRDRPCRFLNVLYIHASVNAQKIRRLAWNAVLRHEQLRYLRAVSGAQLLGREGLSQQRERITLAGPEVALRHHSPRAGNGDAVLL